MTAGRTILSLTFHGPGDAGRARDILTGRGFAWENRMPVKGDPLPGDPADYAGIIIFGGTMSANDDHLDGMSDVLGWIPKVVASGRPLLGCCLGGQLIARALGGSVRKHRDGLWEVGYAPVTATPAGAALFPAPAHYFFSWHQDVFELPAGAELLATGAAEFPNQAFRFGAATFGLQFHPEASSTVFAGWMESSPDFHTHPGAHPRERIMSDAETYEHDADRWFADFLDRWIAAGEPRAAASAG